GERRRRGERYVGRNPAAAADGPPAVGAEQPQRVLGRAPFPREGGVLLDGEAALATLDEAAAGREHVSDREVQVVAVGEHEEVGLHQRLAEATAAQEKRPVVVLEG